MDNEEPEYSDLPEQDTIAPPCSVAIIIIGFVFVSVAVIAFASQFLKDIP